MSTQQKNSGMAIDLRSGRCLTLRMPKSEFLDSDEVVVMIALEAKNGRVARLHVNAPQNVKIGFTK
jgi:hypothetical protein